MSNIIEALTETVRGRVITRSDSDYDEARAVHNAMHDRKPRAVIQCVDSADVMAAVAAARAAGLDLAIRGGGHSVPGFGTVEELGTTSVTGDMEMAFEDSWAHFCVHHFNQDGLVRERSRLTAWLGR